VPVSFGLLTCDTAEQAEARVERGAGPPAPRSRWPTRSRSCEPQFARGRPLHRYTSRPHVQDLLRLREEALVRPSPEPLDGGDQAPLRPEPPARPHRRGRHAEACVRLHALPEERQGHRGGRNPLAASARSNARWNSFSPPPSSVVCRSRTTPSRRSSADRGRVLRRRRHDHPRQARAAFSPATGRPVGSRSPATSGPSRSRCTSSSSMASTLPRSRPRSGTGSPTRSAG
jgi:hypothetical protein